jgi:formylglycine-generating enzyme required for sulfatase activity
MLATCLCAILASVPQVGCDRGKPTKAEQVRPEQDVSLPPEIRNVGDDSVLVLAPAGEFAMGPPSNPRRVTLRAFYIDRCEVTNAQYAKFLAAVEKQGDAAWRHPDQPKTKKHRVPSHWSNAELGEAKKDHPVVGVDWFDAYAYAKWADKRLPTEAEWERAARGVDGRIYPWGNEPPVKGFRYMANFLGSYLGADGYRFTAPVGSFPNGASPVGCLDMAGNVAEWCLDWFAPLPVERRLESPTGPPAGTERVTKGGGWNLSAESIRCFDRWPMEPSRQLASVGFRCAKDAPTPAKPGP